MNSFEAASIEITMELLNNAVLTWGLIACVLAQLSKIVFELIQNRQFRPSIFFETGGMPSSHSALITGTASGIGLKVGFDDPLFALAATVAFVVMYDASGVRRAAGLTSAKVNELVDQGSSSISGKPLKETLGHTRVEVLVGSLFGPAIALPGITFIGSPIDLFHLIGLISG
tara:strand:- start:498 stop:1013 length:516 start_codon:yes stop_codon:yes gene_type:complete